MASMLRWAMRIVVVGCTALAVAVGVAAWEHRTAGREWNVETPAVLLFVRVSPWNIYVQGWLRREWDLNSDRKAYSFVSTASSDSMTRREVQYTLKFRKWGGQ